MPNLDDRVDSFAPQICDHSPIRSASTPSRVWLIGGTTEGIELSRQMIKSSLPCTVSVTTEAAQVRYPQALSIRVQVQRFNSTTLAQFLIAENVAVVLDASHPHAAEISTLAMQAAATFQIPYLRFERLSISEHAHGSVQEVENLASVLCDRYLLHKRVLLTLGAKSLSQFQPWHSCSTLFARILPSKVALQTATDAGFLPERLIALRPPISMEMEIALWRQWKIEQVVTKASGQPGGEATKRKAATALNIDLVIIQRPPLTYPRQTSEVEEAISFCKNTLQMR